MEGAGRTLLAVSPQTETALELMKHRLQVVRGRAILDCLANAKEPWAEAALGKGAPPRPALHSAGMNGGSIPYTSRPQGACHELVHDN